MKRCAQAWIVWHLVWLAGCSRTSDAAASLAELQSPLSAGSGTVFDATHDAFSLPNPTLTAEHRSSFFVGNSFFNQSWVSAPSSLSSRDGLGPLFNARSCSGCHFKDGRGRPPDPGQAPISLLVRISLAADGGEHGAPRPHPIYGDQLQTDALPGLSPEAAVTIEYDEQVAHFPDGESYALRTPRLRFDQLGYGALEPGVRASARVAPAMVGLGLLEAVPDAEILARVDASDVDRDGVSGRANRVWDVSRGALALGRFGWKAEQPSVRQQVAAAFESDMGITSSLFARENHTEGQPACATFPSGGTPEVSDAIFDHVVRYARTLAVPARRNLDDPSVRRGAALFARAGCAGCHRPSLSTGQTGADTDLPELRGQTIHPYTDLLLHDMGEGLSDQRPSFAAQGREWRTPPLWGIGLVARVNQHSFFLHDGRARGLQEAVLWHGGEAEAAKRVYMRATAAGRRDLLAFLESL